VAALLLDALLESSPTRPQTRALEWTLSLAVHGILVAVMFVGPLYWIDPSAVHPSNYTQLVAASAGLGSNPQVSAATSKLAVPKSVPAQPEAPRPQVGETDAGAETAPDLRGTISAAGQGPLPRGLLDGSGVLAGISRAHQPPPGPEAQPQDQRF
jgi:outer membrane biosynthesis protein TonB